MRQPTIYLSEWALEAMLTEARRAHPSETGGMLLGWVNEERSEIVACEIVGPGPTADHRRSGFSPDGKWQQTELDRRYAETDGLLTFIGDWHVHPDGGFAMSWRDRRTMAATAGHPASRCATPLMGLLAHCPNGDYRLGMWTLESTWLPFSPGSAVELKVHTWRPTSSEIDW